MSIFPTWEARVTKAYSNFIVSLGVVMVWTMWMMVAYAILAWFGVVNAPNVNWGD
jgi:hypothetical protein